MIVNTRFPLLSFIAKVLWVFAIILMLIGLVMMAFELIDYSKMFTLGVGWLWKHTDIIRLLISALIILLGITTMAIAEIISVFFAIEINTRNNIK